MNSCLSRQTAMFLLVGLFVACSDESDKQTTHDAGPPDSALEDAGSSDTALDGSNETDASPPPPCAVQRFDNLGTKSVSQLDLDRVVVTASGELSLRDFNGMGVDDHELTDDEWIRFTLSLPMVGVSYALLGGGGPAGSVGATTIEAFDAQNASLGTRRVTGVGIVDVSAQYDNVPILSFKLQPEASASIRVGSLATQCCKHAEDFTTIGTRTTDEVDIDESTVAGSAGLQLTDGRGIGVVGDDDTLIDQDEWVEVTLSPPAIRVAYRVISTADYVPVTLEIFDADGVSLGADTTELSRNELFDLLEAKYDKVSGFKVTADGSAVGHAMGSLEYWTDCR